MMKWTLGALALLAVLQLAQFLSWVRYRHELEEASIAVVRLRAELLDLEMRHQEDRTHLISEQEGLRRELERMRTGIEGIAKGAVPSTGVAPGATPVAADKPPRFHDLDRTNLPRPPPPYFQFDDLALNEQGLMPGFPAAIHREGRNVLQYVVLMESDGTYAYDEWELALALQLLDATRQSESFLASRLRESVLTDNRIERWSTFEDAFDSANRKGTGYRALAVGDDEAYVFPAAAFDGDSHWEQLEAKKRAVAEELQLTVANVIVGTSVVPPEH